MTAEADDVLKTFFDNTIKWEKLAGAYTDGA